MLLTDQAEPGVGAAVGNSLAAQGVFRAAAVLDDVPPAGYLEQDGVLFVQTMGEALVIHRAGRRRSVDSPHHPG